MMAETGLVIQVPNLQVFNLLFFTFIHQASILYLIQCKVQSSGLETKEEETYFPIISIETIHQVPLIYPWMRHFRSILSFSPHKKFYEVGTSSSLAILTGSVRHQGPITHMPLTKPSIVTGNTPRVL